ncbi:MAG: hypothetical protein AB1Z23_03465 [Eubacteriales bacterium]
MSNSLGEILSDRTESLDTVLIEKYYISNEVNSTIIDRLLDSEQYIFEGSRGIGKTMIMKKAEIYADKNFGRDSILTVLVSFEESLRLEKIKIVYENECDPFLQWTMGKILFEILKKLNVLKPDFIESLSTNLQSLFNNNGQSDLFDLCTYYNSILQDYIRLLETGDVDNNKTLAEIAPSSNLTKILNNPTSFKSFVTSLINKLSIKRIVLLFDEAAHVFSLSQQEKFFTFFKSLRSPLISCNAAVYPGITNYGTSFEKGQDAKELKINWEFTNSSDISFIKKVLKKRIQLFDISYWNKLTINNEIIELICLCSNGNPRHAFHLIDSLDIRKAFAKKTITYQMAINNIRETFESKWHQLETLKARLNIYSNEIELAEIFIKETVIPNLLDWNTKRRKVNSKLSSGFYIETIAYDQLSILFSVLVYLNIITTNLSKKSIGHNKFGYYVSVNPSLLFSDYILKNVKDVDNISVSIENNQGYYLTSKPIMDMIEKLENTVEFKCLNNTCSYTSNIKFNFCPTCGAEYKLAEQKSLYEILRSHSINNLPLSKAILRRVGQKFSNIGEIIDANNNELRMDYIQDVRIKKIKSAAIEYMAG